MSNSQKQVSVVELCTICNKLVGVYDCRGCKKSFCRRHVIDHNNKLSAELDLIAQERDMLQSELNGESETKVILSFNRKINLWEQEALKKIQDYAQKLRDDLETLLSNSEESVIEQFESLTEKLKDAGKNEDYSEVELETWKEILAGLREESDFSSEFCLIIGDDNILIPQLSIMKNDKFHRLYGNIEISEQGLVAKHLVTDSFAQAVGRNCYAIGSYRLHLKIESMFNNQWIFLGIISEHTSMTKYSYLSSSVYGWSKWSGAAIFLNGKRNDGFNGYDGDIIEGDVLALVFNCDEHRIELENGRTKKKYTIPVDVNKCPFPWRLHINLYNSNDTIRILT